MLAATTLLISTDPSLILEVQRAHDAQEHLRLEVCGLLDKARGEIRRDDVGLVLLHLAEGGLDAGAARPLLSAVGRQKRVVILARRGDCPEAQAATLRGDGASDVVVLPSEAPRQGPGLGAAVLPLPSPKGPAPSAPAMHGQSFVMLPEREDQMQQVRRVATQETTVLLTGETGTGKTLLARRIHELSPRSRDPFLVVDCGALSASLIESEMFGHVKGAFTGADRNRPGKFAAAGRGTLVLDEINSLPAALQSKLLRVVEERVFEPVGSNQVLPLEARIIAVTNVSLDEEVLQGRFRADLYYRLNVVGFRLPPLRESRRAVAPFACQFLAEFNQRNGRKIDSIVEDALQALESYTWPGNIRQLRNVIERAVALASGPNIELEDLPESLSCPHTGSEAGTPIRKGAAVLPGWPTPPRPEDELQRIAEALHRHSNNRLRAAAELGISRTSLYKKLHKYGLFTGSCPATDQA
ncbi:MAG: sigma-54 dependent transcriptional regulator [Gemmataceae bacterium]|nr:sigma-54 dependent transcriptional regulator [Gemmataceae bacterium]